MSLGGLHGDEVSGVRHSVVDIDLTVNFRRLPAVSTHQQVLALFACAFNQDFQMTADEGPILLSIDPSLDRHDLAPTSLDGFARYLAAHLLRRGASFIAILEPPDPLNPLPSHEFLH